MSAATRMPRHARAATTRSADLRAAGTAGVLVFHIGLPRTGTTFLQHRILRRTEGARLIHRALGEQEKLFCSRLRAYAASGPLAPVKWPRLVSELGALVPEPAVHRATIVSDENISVRSGGFWRGEGPSPERVAARISGLAGALGGRFGPVRVMLGLRRQDRWLASRYAASARHAMEFCQEDFERRLREILAERRLPGPLGWLDHARVCRAFVAQLGGHGLIVVREEKLDGRPVRTLERLGKELGGLDLARTHRRLKRKAERADTNRLAGPDGTWSFKGRSGKLCLPKDLSTAIVARFARSNELVRRNFS
jgi:hypothetical protein